MASCDGQQVSVEKKDNGNAVRNNISDSALIQKIYSMEKKQALSEIQKFAAGTWTSTQTGNFWYKLVVEPNGKAQAYMAFPSDDNWGKPQVKGHIEATTWKDISTGKRLYGFQLKGIATDIGIENNGYMSCALLDNRGIVFCNSVGNKLFLDRGDKFPFSK